jgi:hypothetical protein
MDQPPSADDAPPSLPPSTPPPFPPPLPPTLPSAGSTTLTCPKCGKAEVTPHTGCLVPVLWGIGLIIALLVQSAIVGASGSEPPVVAIGFIAVFVVIAFAGTVAGAITSLFGRHKCRVCGHKWR